MTADQPLDPRRIDPNDFDIHSLDDEIRVDELCTRLLLAVRDRLLSETAGDPLAVGAWCLGADYFLREFVIAECADNLLELPPERVRQFAGHWYIVRTLEPNVQELAGILDGIAACYLTLAAMGLVDPARAEAIAGLCADLPAYRRRIDEFWAIEGDGFDRWRDACPLPARRS